MIKPSTQLQSPTVVNSWCLKSTFNFQDSVNSVIGLASLITASGAAGRCGRLSPAERGRARLGPAGLSVTFPIPEAPDRLIGRNDKA
jgi:hypothetical protein